MTSITTSGRPGIGVASIVRAIRVLEVFADRPEGVALTRLSAELGYGKATLSKVLATMERGHFVRRDTATGHFHLSCRLLALAFAYAERVGIPGLCAPILQALADETGELVQLAVVEGGSVLFVAKAEGPDHRLRMVPLVGAVAPLHATASGKVWLASLSEAAATAALTQQGLARLAPRTITSRARLLAQLRGIRAQGYAIVDEELVAGGRAVAVIRGDGVVGSVAVSGPTFRVPVHKLHRMAPRLKRAAAELAAVWPHEVTARDFGLGVRVRTDNGRPRAPRRHA